MVQLTISQIRSLTGLLSDTVFFTTDQNQEGIWQYDAAGSSADNTGTILNTADGKVIRRIINGPIYIKWFGNIGTLDDTIVVQKAIDALPNGGILDGMDTQFIVTSLILKSNISIQNIRLLTKAGNTNFVSPITIDGTITAKQNIKLSNVHIDGNRANQTGLPNTAFPEDGGRNGFRLLGTMSNITIENCSANNCSNDGIALYSSVSATSSDADLCFKDIIINNFSANWNRRHGGSGDCIDGISFSNTIFQNNGKDLNTIDAYTVGTRGARLGNIISGSMYGNGFDLEGYGIGTAVKNVFINNMVATKNAYSGLVITDPANPIGPNFLVRENITIVNSKFAKGDSEGFGGNVSDSSSLKIASAASVSSFGYSYKNVNILNCQLDLGILELRGIENSYFNGSNNFSGTKYFSTIIDCKNIDVVNKQNGSAYLIYSDNATVNVTILNAAVPYSPTLTNFTTGGSFTVSPTYTFIERTNNGYYRYVISAIWLSTVAKVQGFTIYPLPTNVAIIEQPVVSVTDQNTGLAIVSSFPLDTLQMRFYDPATAPVLIQISVVLKMV